MTTAAPAFWLTRCPRCLAKYKPLWVHSAIGWTIGRCAWCVDKSDEEAAANRAMNLARGRVLSVPEVYEVKGAHG